MFRIKQKYSFLLYILAFLIAVCALPYLPSRSEYNIDNMIFCKYIALDSKDGVCTATFLSYDAESGAERLYAGSGGDIETAFEIACSQADKNIFFGTAELLIIGKNVCGAEMLSFSVPKLPLSLATVYTEENAARLLHCGDGIKNRLEKRGLSEKAELFNSVETEISKKRKNPKIYIGKSGALEER